MGNLRRLKKNIKYLCGDIASECIIAGTFIQEADEKKLADVVYKAAKLQTQSIRKVSVSFTKTPKDFANVKEYRKEKKKYFKNSFSALDSLFFKEADGLIAELNQALPKKNKEKKASK